MFRVYPAKPVRFRRIAALVIAGAVLAPAAPVAGDPALCLRVTVNDRPSGTDTRLRLAGPGGEGHEARVAGGAARFDGLAPGIWKIMLQHPRMKTFRTELAITGTTGLWLDCGHADKWSGCQARPLPGC